MPRHALLGHHLSLGGSAAQLSLAGTSRPLGSSVVAAWGWIGGAGSPTPAWELCGGSVTLPASHSAHFLLPVFPGVGTLPPTHFPKILPAPPLVLKIPCTGTHLFNKY